MNTPTPLLATFLSLGVLGIGTNDQVGADINYGTFQNPSPDVRPRFRYWVNDASVSFASVADDIEAIRRVGGGGAELLGYYLYGDSPNYNGQSAAPLQADWTIYGFGSSAWKNLLDSVITTTEKVDAIVDFAIGPSQGAGVPAPYNDDGLLWDLAGFNSTFAIGDHFSGVVPGWGSGSFIAAATAQIINSTSSSSETRIVLSSESLTDVTDLVQSDGYLQVNASQSSEGIEQVVFAYYLIHSEYRAVQSPADVVVDVPQSPITTYSENGSWVTDHFSAGGAQVVIDFWKQALLDDKTDGIIRKLGNYMWEDSQEYSVSTWWTPKLQQVFESNRGYSVNKYIPLLIGSGVSTSTTYVTNETDSGNSHIVDYQQTLTELNQEYLTALTNWSNELGIQFSAQVVYNLPMDMLANIPYVDAPECETLGFDDNIDLYRQFAGPANLAGKRIISNEAGAELDEAYEMTISELLWTLKRALAGSVNQFVLHGFPNTDNYGNTTWPGFTTFVYMYSNMHGPRQPAFEFYSDFMNWLSRTQFVAQTGIPKVDLAFWLKSTSYKTLETLYSRDDLQEAGYSYEYLSPDNFALPEAFVENSTFAPNRQAFKAMVIQSDQPLTTLGVNKLVEYANAGLPIIFYGGVPSDFSGYNPEAATLAVQSITNLTSFSNVHTVQGGDLLTELQSLNILPRTAIVTNGTWYTYWRHDPNNATDYVYIYNDAPDLSFEEGFSVGNISFETTGAPFLYDAWTGNVDSISVYQKSKTHVTIPLQLAGNQAIIIGFIQETQENLYAQNTTDGVLWIEGSKESLTVFRSFDEEPRIISLSNGESAVLDPMLTNAFTLSNWTLVIESWTPPTDLFDILAGSTRTNYTFQLPTLVPWNSISSTTQNMSGIGYYSTTFTWPHSSTSNASNQSISGAIIDLGAITHTAQVTVNGEALSPVDITWARRDIVSLLKEGENTVDVVVSTPLGNVLRIYWDEVETSGKLATANEPSIPSVAEYGLLTQVQIIPYRKDQVG